MKRIFLFALILSWGIWTGSARGDSFSSLNNKGNKSYKQGQEFSQEGEKNQAAEAWEQALKSYRDAEIERPESPELSYNIGNVMYQQENYQDALERYYRTMNSNELKHQAWSHYNRGNAFYRSGKYPEAIQAYQKCLELTPEDEDAKYNLEFVRKKMKEMLDQEAKRQQEQKQQQPQSEQQQQQQEQQQQSQQPKPQEQKDENQAMQQKEEQKQQEQLKPKEGMSKEEAERILNALKDDEKELLKKQKQAVGGRGRRGGKDW